MAATRIPSPPRGAAPIPLAALAALLLALPAAGGGTEAEGSSPSSGEALSALIELSASDNRVQEHVRHLALGIGPRLFSSSNLRAAEDWARGCFEAWGLEARLEHYGDAPVGFDRGPASGGMVAPERVAYAFGTASWSAGTRGAARGPALLRPTTGSELEALRAHLPGAWIVERPNGLRGIPRWAERIERELEQAGIAGEVACTPSPDPSLILAGGDFRQRWDRLPGRVRVVLRGDHYDHLLEVLGSDRPVELEFDVQNRFRPGPVPQHNVVADLRGGDLEDELVLVAAHLDSWDLAQGAVDDGTGVAVVMEAARLLAASGARPRRTIRFVLFGGEEQGLLGSRSYLRAHPELVQRASAVLVHDGGTNAISGIQLTPEMELEARGIFDRLAILDPARPFTVEVVGGLPNSGSSDHAPFLELGVPAFFWVHAGPSDYDRLHHTQWDTFEEVLEGEQQHSARVVAVAALGLADLERRLERRHMEALPRRELGVVLQGRVIASVGRGSKAARAGWLVGDRVLAVDGVEPASRRDLLRLLQSGDARKRLRLEREAVVFETLIDWSGEASERERARRRKARERGAAR